jgi:O-antigen/teichoic acid export membrane protein
VIVLWQFSPTLHAYFGWQVLASGLQSGITAIALWRSLPRAASPVFRKSLLVDVWRFAAGMTGITIFAVLLTQMDKVILSKLLSLTSFGHYALAALVAGSLAVIVYPLFTALFPRFTQLVSAGDETALIQLYHKGSQLMTVAVAPVAAVVALFARDVLLAWTGKPSVADHAHLLLSLLVIGYALNGLVTVPYALQLAHGWTTLGLYVNMVGVAVLVPGVWLVALHFGAPGAAAVWIVLNACYLLVNVQVMHRRLLKGEMVKWYLHDVAVPAAVAVGIAAFARWLAPEGMSRPVAVVVMISAMVVGVLASSLAAPQVRGWMLGRIGLAKARRGPEKPR